MELLNLRLSDTVFLIDVDLLTLVLRVRECLVTRRLACGCVLRLSC